MMTIGLLIESLIMLAQRYAHLELDIGGISTRELVRPGEVSRISGTVGSPNAAGSYVALMLVPTFVLLVTPVARVVKVLVSVTMPLAVTALILTFSRGGWLSLIVSLVALLALAARRGRIRARAPVIAALVIVSMGVIFHGVIGTRLNGNDRGAAQSRVPLMRLAREMIEQQPLLGVGANNFALRIRDFAGPEFSRDWLYTVHNKYLLVWAEAGIGALAAFLWFLGATLRRGFRASRSDDPLLSPFAAGLTAAVVGQMSDMLVEPYHSRPEIQGLFLCAALITAVALAASVAPHAPASARRGRRALLHDVDPFQISAGLDVPQQDPADHALNDAGTIQQTVARPVKTSLSNSVNGNGRQQNG
jgi:O-antigen ligase